MLLKVALYFCNIKLYKFVELIIAIMSRSFKEALEHRRSYYHITNSSPIPDEELRGILEFGLQHVPSAFNSQSTRIVLLLGENHKKLWMITKEILRQRVASADAFARTEAKIDTSFAAGYGTVLFFENMAVVKKLQASFPTYKDRFPVWAQQTSAMHQLAIWSMLEDVGFGASLQHYNPLIDKKVEEEWGINPDWELIAQMPFGVPLQLPENKADSSLEDKLIVFDCKTVHGKIRIR